MKTATVRDLRNNFRKLEAWLADGETIEIRRRDRKVGTLSPPPRSAAPTNFARLFKERRKRIWGNRVFSDDEVRRMKADELEGEDA